MDMTGVLLRLWNEWEIQILVLVSFALQVLLLSFAWMRRRSISRALRNLLWLMYLLAESSATYTLGHMSIGGKAGEHRQLMAFWAPFLLLHLGGQDTITAYAMEDSQLWLRHLLTFTVQALGAGYVLYKYIGSRGPLVAPAVLVFTVGVLKNAERVWALSFSRLEMIRRYLDGVSIKQEFKDYPIDYHKSSLDDDEWVLQAAHDLLYICMGQFVDDKILPSEFQWKGMMYFQPYDKTFQLFEMQLSLMYDIFYTKAAVIHTWYGRCFRAISLLGTAMAFFLFQFSFSTNGGGSKDGGYNRVDATVTHILIAGALVMEAASVLRAMGSTWTCSFLRDRKWGRLHSLHVSVRRHVRIALPRRWSNSIGQFNLLDSYSFTGDETITCADGDEEATDDEMSRRQESFAKYMRGSRRLRGRGGLGSKVFSFLRDGRSMIPTSAKELVLEEIRRMVEACQGNEGVMRSYRGKCALERLGGGVINFLEDAVLGTNFDQSILVWHLASDKFLMHSKSTFDDGGGDQAGPPSLSLVEATKAISNYMMFLLVECPYMLPSPVRPTLHLQARKVLRKRHYWQWFLGIARDRRRRSATTNVESQVTDLAAKLADELLRMEKLEMPGSNKLLRMIFGVWVEMLCYGAHHCSRESHARQLNNGGEFLTIVWLLTTAEFNRVHYSPSNFRERRQGSIWNFFNFVDFADFMDIEPVLESCWSVLRSCSSSMTRSAAFMSWVSFMSRSAFMQFVLVSCSVIFSPIFLPIRGIMFLLESPWRPPYV